MEINGIRPSNDLAAAASAANANKDLGKDQFLELMVAQFNNQNPLDPAKNEDFIAQLAQFSSLEGIQNLNSTVESMASALRSSMTLESASFVGRSVLAETPRAFMEGEGGLAGNIVNDQPQADVLVEVTDPSGALVRRINLGAQPEGNVRFLWDGADETGAALPAGSYGVTAFALEGDEPVALAVQLPERVVSVSFDGGGTSLNLQGGSSVGLSAVRELQ